MLYVNVVLLLHFQINKYYAIRTSCGNSHKTVECPSVRSSVCLSVPSIDSNSGRQPVGSGLLLRPGTGSAVADIDRLLLLPCDMRTAKISVRV